MLLLGVANFCVLLGDIECSPLVEYSSPGVRLAISRPRLYWLLAYPRKRLPKVSRLVDSTTTLIANCDLSIVESANRNEPLTLDIVSLTNSLSLTPPMQTISLIVYSGCTFTGAGRSVIFLVFILPINDNEGVTL